MVRKYTCRWPIEEYHLTLKSGEKGLLVLERQKGEGQLTRGPTIRRRRWPVPRSDRPAPGHRRDDRSELALAITGALLTPFRIAQQHAGKRVIRIDIQRFAIESDRFLHVARLLQHVSFVGVDCRHVAMLLNRPIVGGERLACLALSRIDTPEAVIGHCLLPGQDIGLGGRGAIGVSGFVGEPRFM